MRRILYIAVVLSFFVISGLLARGSSDDGMMQIGAAMSSFSDKWQTYLQDGVREFDVEHEDIVITMTDGKDDAALQLSQVETLIAQGADALIIVPVDISALRPILKAKKEAGIPIVVINRLPGEEFIGDVDVYVGSDSIQAGIMQGEWVRDALEPIGRVGIIMGPLGHEAAMMRTKGNEDIFTSAGITVDIKAEGKWDRAQGQRIAENWFQSDRKLSAIVANNDEMAIGAVLAAKSMGIADEDIIIAGVDATPDALDYLGQGLDVTVFQSARGQGYGGAEAAYKLLKGETVDKMFWIPYELVTVENADNYR